jgi:hypothetical protein
MSPTVDRRTRALLLSTLMLLPVAALSQVRTARPAPGQDETIVTVRGKPVFIAGYFYDPFFGPYPWWPHDAYPHRYPLRFDARAELRIISTPKLAAVYIDGFYGGRVDDFDGIFQAVPLSPGGHDVTLYLEGFHTIRRSVYLEPGSKVTLRETMELLGPAGISELPGLSPPVPPPPAGSFSRPRSAPPNSLAAGSTGESVRDKATATGTLELDVEPWAAVVNIDGRRWLTSRPGHFVIELPAGRHRVEISLPGYVTFHADLVLAENRTTPLTVSLDWEQPE